MIFVSSTAVKNPRINLSVNELIAHGFNKIELTGGTQYYSGYQQDLLEIKNKNHVEFRLHNYFPPPEKHFVLNLASTNEEILNKSMTMIQDAVDLSQMLGATKFGFHAGFRVSPKPEELNRKFSAENIVPFKDALSIFENAFKSVSKYAQKKGIQLYLENNVFSAINFKSFEGENPFFLTTAQEYRELIKHFPFSLLLDVGHLKVTCQSLKLNFEEELSELIEVSDYLHLSDNNGAIDDNLEIDEDSMLYSILKNNKLKNKTLTLEVYSGLDSVKRSQALLEKIIS